MFQDIEHENFINFTFLKDAIKIDYGRFSIEVIVLKGVRIDIVCEE